MSSALLHRINSMHWLQPFARPSIHHKTSFRSLSTNSSSIHVAFIGLGNMGLPMALNLARSKDTTINIHQLTIHDLHLDNVNKFMSCLDSETMDHTTFLSAQDLMAVADSKPDYIVTSLPTCEASEHVVTTVSHHLQKPCTFIDTSTISVGMSRKLHDLVTSHSGEYVDAPVSGGVKGATDATLTFMVGCSSPNTFTSIQPLLQSMGRSIIPCGSPGSGSAVKLCNNAALAAQMIGICEAMNLGVRLGVDPKVLAGVMNVSTAKCWSSQVNNPHPDAARELNSGASRNDYEGGFGSDLMLKDLNLAMEEAGGQGLVMPVSGLSRDLYEKVSCAGYGAKDFGVMLQYLKEMETQK